MEPARFSAVVPTPAGPDWNQVPVTRLGHAYCAVTGLCVARGYGGRGSPARGVAISLTVPPSSLTRCSLVLRVRSRLRALRVAGDVHELCSSSGAAGSAVDVTAVLELSLRPGHELYGVQ